MVVACTFFMLKWANNTGKTSACWHMRKKCWLQIIFAEKKSKRNMVEVENCRMDINNILLVPITRDTN